MTAIVYVIAVLLVGNAKAGFVELNCSDNATCIENLARELVRSLRQQKTVRIFDLMTIEPLKTREARSSEGPLATFFLNHAFSFDWDNWIFRVANSEKNSNSIDLEVFESRTAKDVPSEANAKKPTGKDNEEAAKSPLKRRKRRKTKKVLQAVVPLVVGMKTAGIAMLAMAVVTALTLKAFFASKIALVVTIGMAAKKLYESYGHGDGLQSNPYLYSQYPIDFPSASSHAYSVSGASPQFASNEIYSPTGLASQPHSHEFLQNDGSTQQLQQAPTVQLLNATRASERWDGYRRRPMFYGTSRATSESYSGSPKSRH